MRRIRYGVMMVLLPFLSSQSFAQCVPENGWIKHISGPPTGQVGGYRQNPTILPNPVDDSFYLVLEYWYTNQVQIDGVISDVNSCEGTGRGILLQKYQSDGQLLWEVEACYEFSIGLVEGAAVDNMGNLYVGGKYSGEMTLDGVSVGNSATTSYFVFKLLPNGLVDWVMTDDVASSAAVGLTWTDQGLLLLLSVNDSVSFNGNTYYNQGGQVPNRDFVVLIIDENADPLWNRTIAGEDNGTIHSVVCNAETCLVQGRFDVELIYDGDTLNTSGYSLFQLAFSPIDGAKLWMKKSTSAGHVVFSNDSKILNDTTVVSVGYFQELLSIDGWSISENTFGTDGYILSQSINTGVIHWLKRFGGDSTDDVMDVAVSSDGIVISGRFASASVNYEGQIFTNHEPEVFDPFILELDLEGKPKCTFENLGTNAEDVVYKIAYIDNHIYALISFRDSTAFDTSTVTAQGVFDVVLWKTCLPCDTGVGIQETTQDLSTTLNLYPNPTTGEVRFNLSNGVKPTGIEVYDMLGKKVMEQPYQPTVNVAGLPKGNYIIAVLTEERSYRKLLVVE